MERPSNWEHEAKLFAQDLFAYVIPRHPLFRNLPILELDSNEVSPFFQDVVGKSVLYTWHMTRYEFKNTFAFDFPRLFQNGGSFEEYLKKLCRIVKKTGIHVFSQVIGFSAVLLELISSLYRDGYTDFLYSAPDYWFFMFATVACDHFYTLGHWETLARVAAKESDCYDNSVDEIWQQYWSLTPHQPEESTPSPETDQKTRDSETSSGKPPISKTGYENGKKITGSSDTTSGISIGQSTETLEEKKTGIKTNNSPKSRTSKSPKPQQVLGDFHSDTSEGSSIIKKSTTVSPNVPSSSTDPARKTTASKNISMTKSVDTTASSASAAASSASAAASSASTAASSASKAASSASKAASSASDLSRIDTPGGAQSVSRQRRGSRKSLPPKDKPRWRH